MEKESEEKIAQLQLLEQNLQVLLMQRQQLQTNLVEVDSALSGLKDAKKTYKIVGNIMVDAKKQDLEKNLNEKKEALAIRIRNLEKQEGNIKEKAKKIQSEILGKKA